MQAIRTLTFSWVVLAAATSLAETMPWVQVREGGRGFMLSPGGQTFTPWGFNYDHDLSGRLLEDYWSDSWEVVVEDFQEMKALDANVVRIHLQFGKFMKDPATPRPDALERLRDLIQLAERVGLYLDVTGLGCYHKKDVPAWYDALDEADRWKAQVEFWKAVAATCAESPAIFCYDLMNEPVVPGGNRKRDDWLGPGFAGKHFVQFIALDRKGRNRAEVAKQWIDMLVSAIRTVDKRHLITVGLVPWSLDRPGLTSGFVPGKIAGSLDFIAMHIYPEKGKTDEALETLKGFAAVGKPVVIEETFPLKSGVDEMKSFFLASREHASGWISFYWGATPEDYQRKPDKSIGEAITQAWLQSLQSLRPKFVDESQ